MPQPKKKRRRHGKKKRSHLRVWFITITLALLGLAIAYAMHHHQPVTTLSTTAKQPPALIKKVMPPPRPQPLPPVTAKTAPAKARFALVIDDMGYHQKVGDALLDLPLNLSFAFLPFAPHTKSQLRHAKARGRDILLHLPMEATDKKWDPGQGALFLAMDRATIRRTVSQDLAAIPGAIGINNHMGSRFTENEPAMHNFLGMVKQRNLFFLDSQTSPNSVGYKIARQLGVLTMHRNVFLDNQQVKEQVKKQLAALIFLAKKQGIAIGIAHPHQATLDALRDFLQYPDKTVTLVGINSLMHNQEKTK